MSLPIVIIFNRHWESSPQHLIRNLLPPLAQEGYDTFCQEIPDSLSEEDAIQWVENQVKKRSVTTDMFNIHANKSKLSYPNDLERCTLEEFREAMPSISTGPFLQLKTLASMKIAHENLLLAKRCTFSIVCIDDAQAMNELNSTPLNSPLYAQTLEKTSNIREKRMEDHLFRLHAEGKGIVVPLGWKHFKPMIEHLKQKGLTDQDIVCHFPHSSYQITRTIDEIKNLHETGQIFSDKTSCATTSEEVALLAKKILAEVQSKIIQNCHILFLSDFFKVHFQPSLGPEYRLDARLPIGKMKDSIRNDLDDLGIQHRTDQNYFVIPNVNTTEVAHDIRLLPYKV